VPIAIDNGYSLGEFFVLQGAGCRVQVAAFSVVQMMFAIHERWWLMAV
jgi:hypothetical protein